MMFVAGGIIYVNTREYRIEEFVGSTSYEGKTYSNLVTIDGFGWPLCACRKFHYGVAHIPEGYYFNRWPLIADIAIGLALTALVGFVCQMIVRSTYGTDRGAEP